MPNRIPWFLPTAPPPPGSVDAHSKDVVFSYTCRKVSQNMGASSALATSVAECLAKHWKDSKTIH